MLEKLARLVGIAQMTEAHLINARSAYAERDWVKLGAQIGAAVDLVQAAVLILKGDSEDEVSE